MTRSRAAFSTIVIPFLVFSPADAQVIETRSITRIEEPFELEGADIPELDGLGLDDFSLYAWRDGEFHSVVHQLDDRGPNGGYFGEDEAPGVVDETDQLVFMIEEVGDQVTLGAWLDAPGVDTDHRYEIEIEDPLNPGQKGWIYAFLGSGLPDSEEDHVDAVAIEPMHIESDRYVEKYQEELPGVQLEMIFTPALGGSGADRVDRGKFRLKLSPLFAWQTENDGTIDEFQYIDGPVRVLVSYKVGLPLVEFDISYTTVIYYRQMSVVKNKISQLWPPEAKRMLWLTDLDPSMDDYTYYDNRGGEPESDYTFSDFVDGDGTRDEGAIMYWAEGSSPTEGTAISVQDNRPIPAETISSYYCDECGEEAWPETGDGTKWGESGTWVKNIPFTSDPIILEAWNYRLAYEEGSRGSEYAKRYFTRTTVATRWQGPLGVAGDVPAARGERVLGANAPNPFNPSTRIPVTLTEDAQMARLTVHDVQGRRVASLHEGGLVTGSHVFHWDGTDQGGRALPSGTYLYRVQVDGQVETRRMLLLK